MGRRRGCRLGGRPRRGGARALEVPRARGRGAVDTSRWFTPSPPPPEDARRPTRSLALLMTAAVGLGVEDATCSARRRRPRGRQPRQGKAAGSPGVRRRLGWRRDAAREYVERVTLNGQGRPGGEGGRALAARRRGGADRRRGDRTGSVAQSGSASARAARGRAERPRPRPSLRLASPASALQTHSRWPRLRRRYHDTIAGARQPHFVRAAQPLHAAVRGRGASSGTSATTTRRPSGWDSRKVAQMTAEDVDALCDKSGPWVGKLIQNRPKLAAIEQRAEVRRDRRLAPGRPTWSFVDSRDDEATNTHAHARRRTRRISASRSIFRRAGARAEGRARSVLGSVTLQPSCSRTASQWPAPGCPCHARCKRARAARGTAAAADAPRPCRCILPRRAGTSAADVAADIFLERVDWCAARLHLVEAVLGVCACT